MKGYFGECLVLTGNCFSCCKSGHKVHDCPNLKGQDKGSDESQLSGSHVYTPKKNRFYALRSRDEQETSANDVKGMLKVYSIYVYVLLDPSATWSFVTTPVAKMFIIFPDILSEAFMVSSR